MNLAACQALATSPENAIWYRTVLNAFLPAALNSTHTTTASSRFNAGSLLPASNRYASLYFAEDPLTALFEVGAVLGSLAPGAYIPHPRLAHSMLAVHVVLRSVVDLTDPTGAQAALATNVQELTGDWRGYRSRNPSTSVRSPTGSAPTQDLGEAMFNSGVEGFRAVSARLPFNKTLVVFPAHLRSGSSLVHTDVLTGDIVHEIRG